MARPQDINDLKDTESRTIKVGKIDFENLGKLRNAEITLAVQRMLEVMDSYGFEYEETYNGTELRAHLSSHDLQKKLKQAQEEWDKKLKEYMEALRDVDSPSFTYSFQREALNRWAREEGHEPIDWNQRTESD